MPNVEQRTLFTKHLTMRSVRYLQVLSIAITDIKATVELKVTVRINSEIHNLDLTIFRKGRGNTNDEFLIDCAFIFDLQLNTYCSRKINTIVTIENLCNITS